MSNKVAPSPLYEIFKQFKSETFKDLRVCLPGKISSVNAATGTVSVDPGVMQHISQQYLPQGLDFTYPTLTDCPVFTLQGGGVGAVMPISIGDQCLIIFSDRCIDSWHTTGQAMPLPSVRMHDISDGFVLVGLNALAKDGTTTLKTSLITGEGGICETANITGAKVVVNVLTHKVSIKNSTQDLGTILSLLLTTLITLNGLLASMTTATIASGATQTLIGALTGTLTTISTDIAALLY